MKRFEEKKKNKTNTKQKTKTKTLTIPLKGVSIASCASSRPSLSKLFIKYKKERKKSFHSL